MVQANVPSQTKVKESIGKLPLAFEPNQGQVDPQVKFLARAQGYTAFLTASKTVLAIKGSQSTLSMKMVNAQPGGLVGSDVQPGKSNYYRPDRNIANVPHYGRVTYKGVYPGIDVTYYGNQRNLEYDFVVSPGADPNQIRIAYEGSRLALDAQGNLALGHSRALKPVVYQTINGARRSVQGEYALLADNQVGFKLGAYDRSQALIIDPTLQVLADLGGTLGDEGLAIAATSGGVYLAGRTQSANLLPSIAAANVNGAHSLNPVGNYDAFVIKLDPTGTTLVYETYIGGAGDDSAQGIAVDTSGNAFVVGYTNLTMAATPAPVVAFTGVYAAFIAKLGPLGALAAQTYLGGAGTTQAFSVAMDPAQTFLVIGGLTTGLPSVDGAQKTFNNGNTTMGGQTDGFLATFDLNLNAQHSTYLGGGGADQINAVTVGTDLNGAVAIYAAGISTSGNGSAANGGFPTAPGTVPIALAQGISSGNQAAIVAKFSTSLSSKAWASIFGTAGDTANGIAVDPTGVAYVVGATKSIGFDSGYTNPGGGSNPVVAGGLPTITPAFGAPITGAAPVLGVATEPSPRGSQGFVLALNSGINNGGAAAPAAGTIKYLVFGPEATAPRDAANTAACNLNIPKTGGAFPNNPCIGTYSSFNVALADSDLEAYVGGQDAIAAGQLGGRIARFTASGILNSTEMLPGAAATASQILGLSVNSSRELFFDGITNVATVAGLGAGPLVPASTTVTYPSALTTAGNQGSSDVLYGAIQFLDIFATPASVNLGSVGVNTGTGNAGPSRTVALFNQLGVAQTCAGGTILGPSPAGGFTISQIPSTNTFQIQLAANATNTPAVLGPSTFTIACPGADNVSTVTATALVTGSLSVTPSNTLTTTSVVGSGVVNEYNVAGMANAVNFQVTTAAGTVAYTATETGRSSNWPTCGLTSLYNTVAGNATPPPGAQFGLNVNNNCLGQLPVGVYSENITVTPANGLAPTVSLPWSITVQNGQVVNQFGTPLIFGSSTSPQQSSFTVQAPMNATGPTTFNVNYVPTAGPGGLPAGNVTVANPTGSNPPNGSTTVTYTVNPVGLGAGVYTGTFLVSSPTAPTSRVGVTVFVGTGLATTSPAGPKIQPLNISVPAGLTSANLTQPWNPALGGAYIIVQGLDNTVNTPYTVKTPTLGTFTPALPVPGSGGTAPLTVAVASGASCNTYAYNSVTNPYGANSCFYTLTVDTTLFSQPTTATTYTGTLNFASQTGGPTLAVPINLTITPFPQLGVNFLGAPVNSTSGVTMTAVAGSNVTTCSPAPYGNGSLQIVATGGSIPNVAYNTNGASWLGLFTGNQGSGVNFNTGYGSTTPNVIANQLSVGGGTGPYSPFTFSVCVNPSTLPNRAGTYTGSVTVSGGGVGSVVFPVNLIVTGTPGTSSAASFQQIGIFRGVGSQGVFVLDPFGTNNYQAGDKIKYFGLPGDIPVAGDFFGTGTINIGVFRCSAGGCQWYIDKNNNGTWDGVLGGGSTAGGDAIFTFGLPGDIPVVGDWTGDGISKIGVFRCPATGSCTWVLDAGNKQAYDAATARIGSFGLAGDKPVVNNWAGGRIDQIGVFRNGMWIVDSNGSGTWAPGDATYSYGLAGDYPVVGNWFGDVASPISPKRIGVFRPGSGIWILNRSGSNSWLPTDPVGNFGMAGDQPVVGFWTMP